MAPNTPPDFSSSSSLSCLSRQFANPAPRLTTNSSYSSFHEMPRTRKLRVLVAANGQRDVAYAQALAVRMLKDAQIETRALVDEVPARLAHDIIVMENRSLACLAVDADQRTRDAIEAARQTAFELVDWADLLVLAPIDADHLAKMMSGIADTTLLEILRAWDVSKKILLVPGMSVQMWENPMTKKQLSKINRKWGWVKVMAPVLWHYEGPTSYKRVVSWDGFNDLVGIIKNQAELMSLGHDVEVAAQQAMHMTTASRSSQTLPPEVWTLIFEYVGDWELATSLDIYTKLKTPPEWKTNRANLVDPVEIYMNELEWLILLCPKPSAICQKLAEAPKGLRYVSSLAVKLIIKFSLTDVLTYLETHLSKVFWASFSAKLLPNKASGVYGRTDILNWWNTSPSFLKKEYDAEALDNASRMGYVHVLDWWLRSGLALKYTEAALESASAKGHLLVLEWWRDAARKQAAENDNHNNNHNSNHSTNQTLNLKPGRSLLTAAQHGQTAVLRWWETSGIPVAHAEGVCKIASAYGQTGVLELWRELKGDKLAFDANVLVAPTKQGHVRVLEWWKQYARGEHRVDDGRTHRVEYKTCDIEEALEDAIGDPRLVRRWWARNGLNLGLGTSEWMKVRCL
ncbi:flavoprotein [Whalleya microplaca]|nr:flavoprotein [Whalleya microplaca]